MTPPHAVVKQALALLRGLRAARSFDQLIDVDGSAWTLEGQLFAPCPMPEELSEALFSARRALHGLTVTSAEDCVTRAREILPTSVGHVWRALRGELKVQAPLSAAVRHLMASASIPPRAGQAPPAFVAWLQSIERDHLWRYADAPPLPGIAPLSLDRMWVQLHLVEDLSALRQGRKLDPDELSWRREPTGWLLERLGGLTLVVGSPGAGKTTLLRWLARQLVVDGAGIDLVPIFVSLRRYAQALVDEPTLSIVDWFARAQCLDDPQVVDWLLRRPANATPGVVGLLDGWDEIPESQRARVTQAIEAFVARFPAAVLTSRRSACPLHLPFRDVYALADLSPAGVEALIRHWAAESETSISADELIDLLDSSEDLQRMARNPFLLTLICALATTAAGQLPRTRSALYERILTLIRHQHDRRGGSKRRFGSPEEAAVDQLAMWLMDEAPGAPRYTFEPLDVTTATADELLFDEVLRPARLFRALPDEHRLFAFLHATFQEFCAARALAVRDIDLPGLLSRRGLSAGWIEVFRFLAALEVRHASTWWTALRSATAHFDRFGVMASHLAVFVAEAGAVDGGQELLGVDLREILWEHFLSMPGLGPVTWAHQRLDVEDLVQRIREELSQAPHRSAWRAALIRRLRQIPTRHAEAALVETVLTGQKQDALLASYVDEGTLGAAGRLRLRRALRAPSVSDETAARIIDTLAHARDGLIVDELITLLVRRPSLRVPIIRGLGIIGTEASVAALDDLLTKADLDERAPILEALGYARIPEARTRLIEHLLDLLEIGGPVGLLEATLDALTELPVHHGANVIAHLLSKHSDARVRLAAAWALVEARASMVAEALATAAAHDVDPHVRGASLATLKARATPEQAEWLSRIWLQEPNAQARADALTALLCLTERGADGPARPRLRRLAVEAIERALRSPAGDEALAAAMHGYAAGPGAEPALLRVLEDEHASNGVKEFAIVSLGRLGSRAAIPTLTATVERARDAGGDEAAASIDGGIRCAQRAADVLSSLAPDALRELGGATADDALARRAHQQQWLVYSDRIERAWPGSTEASLLVLRPSTRTLEIGGDVVEFTPTRWAVLAYLLTTDDEVITHLDIIHAYDPGQVEGRSLSDRSRRIIADIRKRLRAAGPEAAALATRTPRQRERCVRRVSASP